MCNLKVLLFCLLISTYQCIFSNPKKETIEEQLSNSLLGQKAEITHFTRNFGFVDYRVNKLFDLEKFIKLGLDHGIELEMWTPKLWKYMVKEITNMKMGFCEDTLKDPVLKENDIAFDDDVDDELIRLGIKEVVFFRYKRMPVTNYLVKCPITIQGKDGYFAYITLFERTEAEGDDDFYFILLDLYHEDVQDRTDQVVVVIRTKLGARIPLLQRFNEFLKKSFNSMKYRLGEFRE